jgi:hypothetical protein
VVIAATRATCTLAVEIACYYGRACISGKNQTSARAEIVAAIGQPLR